jgi:hypothetical protein
VDREGGFSWWPHQQRQDIYVDRERSEQDGTRLERVVVSTEIGNLHQAENGSPAAIAELTRLATLSGMVREGRRLRLHCHAWVEKSNLPLYDMVLGLIAGLQLHEASVIAAELTQNAVGDPLLTPHPTTGLREEPDEIASVVDSVITPVGQLKTPWPNDMFQDLQDRYLSGPPCLLANAGDTGITAEFPFGAESSLMQASREETHPLIGNGLLVRSAFDLDHVRDACCHDPLALNAWEIEHANQPFFGSWCPSKNGRVAFVTFVPNALQHPAAATNSIMLSVGRARTMSTKWLGDDWSKTWDKHGNCRAKTAMERLMGGPDS